MAPAPRSEAAALCHADPYCRRAACFRIRTHAESGEVIGQPAYACADHLGALVRELARSAKADGLSEGCLQVSAIASEPAEEEAESSFPFASIAIALGGPEVSRRPGRLPGRSGWR